jgi:hypothetical protein
VVPDRVQHARAPRLEARQLAQHGRQVRGGAARVVGVGELGVPVDQVAEAHDGGEAAAAAVRGGGCVLGEQRVDGRGELRGDLAVAAGAALKAGVVLGGAAG